MKNNLKKILQYKVNIYLYYIYYVIYVYIFFQSQFCFWSYFCTMYCLFSRCHCLAWSRLTLVSIKHNTHHSKKHMGTYWLKTHICANMHIYIYIYYIYTDRCVYVCVHVLEQSLNSCFSILNESINKLFFRWSQCTKYHLIIGGCVTAVILSIQSVVHDSLNKFSKEENISKIVKAFALKCRWYLKWIFIPYYI